MPHRLRARSDKGFSLIELLIAMFIIMVSMLATLSMTLYAMRANMDNEMRTTATRIINQTGEVLMTLPLTPPLTSPELTAGNHSRGLNNPQQDELGFPSKLQTVRGSRQEFTIGWQVVPKGDAVRIDVTVSYMFRNKTFYRYATLFKEDKI